MQLFIYIDESGSFDEKFVGGRASVVGGVCSLLPPDLWNLTHIEHLRTVDESGLRGFNYPSHYHCGPLIARKINAPLHASTRDIVAFAHSVFDNILSHSLFTFISRNRGKKFEYSPQATYVMNLIAAIRYAFERISEFDTVASVTICIAQRTISETVTSRLGPTAYMSALLDYVREQLQIGDGKGAELAKQLDAHKNLTITSGIGDRDAGLIAADFICSLARQGHKSKNTDLSDVMICAPDYDLLLGDYKRFNENQAKHLIDNKYYGSYLEFLCKIFPIHNGIPNLDELFKVLETEQEGSVLERELPALLNIIHMFAKYRTEAPYLLSAATLVAAKMESLAEKQKNATVGSANHRLWLNLQIQTLSELSTCYNHIGAVGPQESIESKLTSLLEESNRDSGIDALQRICILMDVRNKNLNVLFNDYRFEDAYTLAAELLAERASLVGNATDKLTGQINGSLGQACAFMAKQDSAWSKEALNYFNASIVHFAPDSRQYRMSDNFITTTLWQNGLIDEAYQRIQGSVSENINNPSLINATELLNITQPERSAFTIVNRLRLVANIIQTCDAPIPENLIHACRELENTAVKFDTDHPYEQWWKCYVK